MTSQKEFLCLPEKLKDLSSVCKNGAAISRTRLLLQDLNLLNRFPIGGKESAHSLSKFFRSAEEGFFLIQTSKNFDYQKILNHFMEVGLPTETDIQDLMTDLGFDSDQMKVSSRRASGDIAVYAHVLTTFSYLALHRKVTFSDFPASPDSLNLGPTEFQDSYWYRDLSPENLWDMLTNLHEKTEKILYSSDILSAKTIIPVGHFFTAGMNLSEF